MRRSGCLPDKLYRAEQVRLLDQCAIDEFGIPGISLMQRAARFAFDELMAQWPRCRRISVWCGSGNNGGDGYLIAGMALNHDLAVQLVQVGDEARLRGDAASACQWARQAGVEFTRYSELEVIDAEVVVDAMLGTGLDSDVRGVYQQAITQLNDSGLPVLAVDIPSGLCSDTGAVLGAAVRAEKTATFIAVKRGMLTGRGPACCGRIVFSDLAVPSALYERIQADVVRIGAELLPIKLAPRKRDAHKGDFGHVLIVGGNSGMGGAAIMAAQSAGRVGAGLVSVATQPEHLSAVLARCPEVMAHGVTDARDLEALLAGKDVVVVGPGLGQNAWSERMLSTVVKSGKKLVVDADALNLISAQRVACPPGNDWLITPHPGEAARLLGESVAYVQADRFAAVLELQRRYGAAVLLKGAGSLVAGTDGQLALCSAGNPGMATGGMGDVLSGILGALLAQGFDINDAARLGVVLHAEAADCAAKAGERGLLATDLLGYLRRLVNPGQVDLI